LTGGERPEYRVKCAGKGSNNAPHVAPEEKEKPKISLKKLGQKSAKEAEKPEKKASYK